MALFNFIFARHFNGTFIVRIEDTDQTRSRPEFETSIFEALKWAGLSWDEGPDVGGPFGPYRQSERTSIYREHCDKLLKAGKAYKCFATQEELKEMRQCAAAQGLKGGGYNRKYRDLDPQQHEGKPYVVRLKVPLCGECLFEDGIKGKISYPWADIDDQVLMKSDGFPTYHLAAVVDDHLMQISHVIRGDEWMSSTPKHILLYESFGWTPPTFLHMPLLLGKDGRKLSKRRNPTSIFYYRDSGYLKEAFINFLTLMGYSMPADQEIYSLQEIIQRFDPKRIGVSGAFFDMQKLDWLNQQYLINTLSPSQLWERMQQWLYNDAYFQRLIPLCQQRMKTFGDFMQLCSFFFVNHLPYSDTLLVPAGQTKEKMPLLLQSILWSLDEQEDWSRSGVEKAVHLVSERFGVTMKKVTIPLLYGTLMGKSQGPSLYEAAEVLGKDRTRARLLNAIEFLGGISNKKMEALTEHWRAGNCQAL
jgi:glutamyl-tRNA synthetase